MSNTTSINAAVSGLENCIVKAEYPHLWQQLHVEGLVALKQVTEWLVREPSAPWVMRLMLGFCGWLGGISASFLSLAWFRTAMDSTLLVKSTGSLLLLAYFFQRHLPAAGRDV